MKKLAYISAVFLAASIGAVAPVQADFGSDNQSAYLALRGVRQVAVHLSGFHPDFERSGLRANDIRAAIEQQLRAGGIEVIDEDQAARSSSAALMRVELHADRTMYGPYSYAARLQMDQKIPLGNNGAYVSEKVWSRGTSGWVTTTELRRVNAEFHGLVQAFLAEHASQNGAAAAR
jgi:hypothetical protein